MKKVLVFVSISLLAACNSKDSEKTESMKSASDTSMTTMRDINSPYTVTYSSKFAIGDPMYAEAALGLWKDWDNGDLSASKSKFADSVELHFSDGSMMKGTSDSVLAAAQGFRSNYAKSESTVNAVVALKSTDKNENWACIWGMEKLTDKKGKVDSSYLQETWRFNNAGKVDLLYQFKAAAMPMKK